MVRSMREGAARPGAARDRLERGPANLFSVGKSLSDVLALCLSFGDFPERLLLSTWIRRTNIAENR